VSIAGTEIDPCDRYLSRNLKRCRVGGFIGWGGSAIRASHTKSDRDSFREVDGD
jgi:hypothetical protein